nr:hypothetical protein [Tanacetum cinerariifolium]
LVIVNAQTTHTVITHNAAFQVDDLDTYDSDCDEINTAKVALMANVSHYGLDDLAEKSDDPINVINHMMSFLTAVVTSRHTSLAAGTSRTYTSRASGNNSWKQMTVICYNCKGESHMSKHYTKPKRKRNESWFKNKKAHQLEPKLYDGNVIQKTNAIVIRDSEETLMLAEESRSKMLQKQKDPMMSEKKVNTKPVDYAVLNQLSQDYEIRFVQQTELSAEQAFWSQNFVNSPEPTPSTRPTQVEVPKEILKVSMVNTSLKKLKHHL